MYTNIISSRSQSSTQDRTREPLSVTWTDDIPDQSAREIETEYHQNFDKAMFKGSQFVAHGAAPYPTGLNPIKGKGGKSFKGKGGQFKGNGGRGNQDGTYGRLQPGGGGSGDWAEKATGYAAGSGAWLWDTNNGFWDGTGANNGANNGGAKAGVKGGTVEKGTEGNGQDGQNGRGTPPELEEIAEEIANDGSEGTQQILNAITGLKTNLHGKIHEITERVERLELAEPDAAGTTRGTSVIKRLDEAQANTKILLFGFPKEMNGQERKQIFQHYVQQIPWMSDTDFCPSKVYNIITRDGNISKTMVVEFCSSGARRAFGAHMAKNPLMHNTLKIKFRQQSTFLQQEIEDQLWSALKKVGAPGDKSYRLDFKNKAVLYNNEAIAMYDQQSHAVWFNEGSGHEHLNEVEAVMDQ